MSDFVRKEPPLSGKETAGKWTVFGMASIGIFMATLDASIVNISLPNISHYFEVPLSGIVEWVIIAYLVVIAGSLLTLGRLSDIIGRKAVWVSGLLFFTAGSALCGAAPSLLFLVISRAFQGIGGAMMMAISPAMITHAFPSNERGKALGMFGTIVAIGTSAGPTLGGVITQAFSWRWIFYINVPIGVIGIFAAVRMLKESVHLTGAAKRFDLAGAALLSAGMTFLMLAMTFGQEVGWASLCIAGLCSAAVVLLLVFAVIEKRVAYPVVDLSVFRNRVFSAALISSFLSFLSLFAIMFLMPFCLEELLAFEPHKAGLVLTAVPLTMSLLAPLSGWLPDRFGSQVLSSVGLVIASTGLFLLSGLTQDATLADIIPPLILAGAGQAIFQFPNNNAIMSSVPENRIGIGSGFLATVRVLGQGFSVAVAGAIFTSLGGAQAGAILVQRADNSPVSLQHTFVHAFHAALLTCAIIAGIGVFTSLARGQARPSSRKIVE